MLKKITKKIQIKLKKIIKNILFFFKKLIFLVILKIKIKLYNKYKLIIGVGSTNYSGWILTDQITIDILDKNSFSTFFKKNSISNILAEHVFEHLDFNQGYTAIKKLL